MEKLFTKWGEALDGKTPLTEYPRPQLKRDSYINLNGLWQYAITKCDEAPEAYQGNILVPFSPESQLSGVGRVVGKEDTLHYRRTFTLPEGFVREKVIINFGAVDQRATVYVNGHKVGSHTGGYLPFSLDITQALCGGENVLTVTVKDNADDETLAKGRQSYTPGGVLHTSFSGIWQTVWLESVPEKYVTSLNITPDFDGNAVSVEVFGCDDGTVAVLADGCEFAAGDIVNGVARIPMDGFRPWSCSDPFLYDLVIRCGEDTVESYFGMRKFSTVEHKNKYVTALNNQPFFMKGIMDQGVWSDGLMTPPSDEAMVHDIETAASMGFNMIKKADKIEPARWYYHCDRLGVLVWQEMVPSGAKQNRHLTQKLSKLGMFFKDNHYSLYGRRSLAGREQFKSECLRTVDCLYNCVSICTWVLFSRGRGQFDSMALTQMLWDEDRTRLVDSASGWHDQGGGDFKSRHLYSHRFRLKNDGGRALAVTGCGGYGLDCGGHSQSRTHHCKEFLGSADKLAAKIKELFSKQLLPLAREEKLCVLIYTQLSDVQDEIDGLMSCDRRTVKIPSETVTELLDQFEM